MPNGADKNLVRLRITCSTYRARFGEWPSQARMHPLMLWDLAQVLDHDEFVKLATHLQLRTKDRMELTVGGAPGVVDYEEASARIDDETLRLTERWLDVHARDDLETMELLDDSAGEEPVLPDPRAVTEAAPDSETPVPAGTAKRIIPITTIMRRYQTLRAMPQRDRLAEAQRLVEHPGELAAEFAQSVTHFTSYDNLTDHFYPPERAKRSYADEVKRTNDLVLRLDKQGDLHPVDAAGRVTEHDAGLSVTAVPASGLVCTYVDRELLVQRTASPAEWEDGSLNRGGVRLDVLLADAADRTPIVGELKLPGDMDPFFALVQALANAAHLATANQYERMRRHLGRGNFPEVAGPPRLDVFVLFADPPGYQYGEPPKGRYMAKLQICAEELAPRLLAHEALTASIRRIAGLGLNLDTKGRVAADVRWAWTGSRPSGS
jgi:hypothetical protein